MADPTDAATPSAAPANWVHITNVSSGDCIPLNFDVTVSYGTTLGFATVGIECPGAPTPGPLAAPAPGGTKKFSLGHGGAGGGHTITAALRNRGVWVAGDSVGSVGVGNPCPLAVSGFERVVSGLPAVDPSQALAGTFEAGRGNGVFLLVERPGKAGGTEPPPPPTLVFADPAQVYVGDGTWTHPVIRAARKGDHLRVVLTTDGEVRAIVRAVFD